MIQINLTKSQAKAFDWALPPTYDHFCDENPNEGKGLNDLQIPCVDISVMPILNSDVGTLANYYVEAKDGNNILRIPKKCPVEVIYNLVHRIRDMWMDLIDDQGAADGLPVVARRSQQDAAYRAVDLMLEKTDVKIEKEVSYETDMTPIMI